MRVIALFFQLSVFLTSLSSLSSNWSTLRLRLEFIYLKLSIAWLGPTSAYCTCDFSKVITSCNCWFSDFICSSSAFEFVFIPETDGIPAKCYNCPDPVRLALCMSLLLYSARRPMSVGTLVAIRMSLASVLWLIRPSCFSSDSAVFGANVQFSVFYGIDLMQFYLLLPY